MTTNEQHNDAGTRSGNGMALTLTDVIGEAATADAATAGRLVAPEYPELKRAGRILNAGMTRSLLIEGNVGDLYFDPKAGKDGQGAYVPLVDLLTRRWNTTGRIVLTYQLNGPIKIEGPEERKRLQDAWVLHRVGHLLTEDAEAVKTARKQFDDSIRAASGQPSVALEMLRQLCLVSRGERNGRQILPDSLLIIIEGMDMLVPEAEASRLQDADRYRLAICHDWLTDPSFTASDDVVVMVTESRGAVNSHVSRLPQLLSVSMPSPNEDHRRHCIEWFNAQDAKTVSMPGGMDFAQWTAGLSVHALLQLMRGARHGDGVITAEIVTGYVEEYIKSQLGDDVVEFKKPTHRLDETVGNARLKAYLKEQLIPRFKARDKTALTGACVSGPIGGGKTFLFEAVAAELDMPVLVLKSIRSQWYGQTDVIIGRLRRLLGSLSKALIFVDEADSQFSDVSKEEHSTEKRATGQFLQMMSDPAFKGRILWLLMTARVHLLPPDMKRPGRVGDLIIPVLDPDGEDRKEFIAWAVKPVVESDDALQKVVPVPAETLPSVTPEGVEQWIDRQGRSWLKPTKERIVALGAATLLAAAVAVTSVLFPALRYFGPVALLATGVNVAYGLLLASSARVRARLRREASKRIADIPKEKPLIDLVSDLTKGYSAAAFTLLRTELKVAAKNGKLDAEGIFKVVRDIVPPTIEDTRRYQTLLALLNCTRRSLLPDIEGDLETVRGKWQEELAALERKGMR